MILFTLEIYFRFNLPSHYVMKQMILKVLHNLVSSMFKDKTNQLCQLMTLICYRTFRFMKKGKNHSKDTFRLQEISL